MTQIFIILFKTSRSKQRIRKTEEKDYKLLYLPSQKIKSKKRGKCFSL
jgi:hypothetical protein